jgi:hypothetical protein
MEPVAHLRAGWVTHYLTLLYTKKTISAVIRTQFLTHPNISPATRLRREPTKCLQTSG